MRVVLTVIMSFLLVASATSSVGAGIDAEATPVSSLNYPDRYQRAAYAPDSEVVFLTSIDGQGSVKFNVRTGRQTPLGSGSVREVSSSGQRMLIDEFDDGGLFVQRVVVDSDGSAIGAVQATSIPLAKGEGFDATAVLTSVLIDGGLGVLGKVLKVAKAGRAAFPTLAKVSSNIGEFAGRSRRYLQSLTRSGSNTAGETRVILNQGDNIIRIAEDAPNPASFCSFSGETEVLMADGTTKPISEVEVGDMVLAEDPETAERGPREVTHLWVHQDTLVDLEIDGHDVATTEDHPFWNHTDNEWQRADALDSGDLLLTSDGDLMTVDWMDWGSARRTTAYNLTVDDIHTYFVEVGGNEVLVHNTCPNPGNLKKLTTSQIEDAVGTSVHQFKYDILGEGAQISRFDVFREADVIYLVEKSTGNIVETGYRIPGAG